MKRILAAVVALGIVGVAAYVFLNRKDASEGQAPVLASAPASAKLLARGEYLTKAADCVACHTVGETGKPFAGGVPFVLPFGTIYSSNITADETTGIGKWTDDQFVRALHDGLRDDGQRLYPAFPYTSYTLLSRDDALAIKTYLFSLPKVTQANRPNDLGFPFNQRWAMGFWNAAFFKNQRFVADSSQSTQWNEGAYLATALGHCGECHTPRNFGFAMESGNALAGSLLQGWRVYNITSDPDHGIGRWTDEELASYLSTGHAQGRGSAGGPMGEAVANSLQYLAPGDVSALVTYLRTVPARKGKDPVSIEHKPAGVASAGVAAPAEEVLQSQTAGLKLFEGACASCHQWNGQGQQTSYASLVGTRGVNDPEGSNVAQIILHGVKMRVHGEDVFMPAFAQAYSDAEVAAVTNFIVGQFGGKKGEVTAAEVAELRRQH